MNSTHLTTVIDDYIKVSYPNYAIMINGDWGCGKTHFIEDYFNNQKKAKMIYVSLYGVDSITRIEDEIFSSIIGADGISEGEIKKAGDFIGKIVSSFGDKAEGTAIGAFASTIGSSLKSRAVRSIDNNTVLVFDDLERAKLEPNQCLSKVNEYVEHLRTKVIVICDESKIKDGTYLDYKEKVVLFTNHLERSSSEIVEICISQNSELPVEHKDIAKQELQSLIELFQLTNIRTIQHSYNCFVLVVNKLYEMDFSYKTDPIICDLLFPCIAFAVGYRDMKVPLSDLEQTSSSYIDLSMRYHMKSDSRKERNDNEPPSPWEKFYSRILNKTNKHIEFIAIFNLICKGHLDKNLLNKDIEKWNIQEHGAEYPITNFRVDENIDEDTFQTDIKNALALLEENEHVFQSTENLFVFCRNFYYLHKRCAFEADSDFLDKLTAFAKSVVDNCINHSEISFINQSDTENEYVNSILEMLIEKSKKLRKSEQKNRIKKDLITAIEQQDRKVLENISNQPSVVIYDQFFTTELLQIIPAIKSANLRCFGIFMKDRYSSTNIFDFLHEEIDSLVKLDLEIKKIIKTTPSSLHKYMLFSVSEIVTEIANKAKEYQLRSST